MDALDLTTTEGLGKASRELKNALFAVEVVNLTQQLLAGLVMAREFKEKVASMECPPLQPGDLDFITGLRIPTRED